MSDEYTGEAASEVIDWMAFREDPGWSSEMYKSFDRLTSSCPGYMGKSQVLEFIKEIHKLFQPQISQLRRGRDRLRGRKTGPKETVTQLGAVSRDTLTRDAHTADDYQAVPPDLALDSTEEVSSCCCSCCCCCCCVCCSCCWCFCCYCCCCYSCCS